MKRWIWVVLLGAAVVTNSAFASELYLKCLIQLETRQLIKDEHNLRTLFAKLPDKTKEDIEKRFNALMTEPEYDRSRMSKEMQEAISKRPKTFRDSLKAGGNAFVEWRYLYEAGEASNPFGLFNLPTVLREVILERQPEWGRFGFTLTKISDVRPTSPSQKTKV